MSDRRNRRLNNRFTITEILDKKTEGKGMYVIARTDPETRKRYFHCARYNDIPKETFTRGRKRQTREQAKELIVEIQKQLLEKYKDSTLI